MVAIADAFEAGQVVEQAREINAGLRIIARAHSEEEIEHLRKHGASTVIMGEHLIGHAMIADARTAGLLAAEAVTPAAEPPTVDAPAAEALADAMTATPASETAVVADVPADDAPGAAPDDRVAKEPDTPAAVTPTATNS
jgi:CPA2 family monovalent cation:H+ antiporter-2